jgi:hypothetical protein
MSVSAPPPPSYPLWLRMEIRYECYRIHAGRDLCSKVRFVTPGATQMKTRPSYLPSCCTRFIRLYIYVWWHAVVQLVEALLYKLEGSGFDSWWCHCGPGVCSASNRNEYQEYFLEGKGGRCVGLTTLPHSCADCLEIWEPQPPGTLWACPGL